MSRRASRILWLIGLIVMLAHTAILTMGTIVMSDSRELFETQVLPMPLATRAALWIAEPGWWYLALSAGLDVLVIVAHVRAARGQKFSWWFAGSLLARLLLLLMGVAAIAYLVSLGRIPVESGPYGTTWRVFVFSDVVRQVVGQLYLSVPLVVFALRWLPLLWPAHRRRLEWARNGCCLTCGYDTRAAPGDRCPECGAIRTVNQVLTAAGR